MEYSEVIKLYGTNYNEHFSVKNTSHGNLDERLNLFVEFDNSYKLAIKVCSNPFTSKERIIGWKSLMEEYLQLGIYCPQIIKNVNGNISKTILGDGKEFIIYAEEFKKYKCADEFDQDMIRDSNGQYIYTEKALESIGAVASQRYSPVPWWSQFCLYDTFSPEDKHDESYTCADIAFNYIKKFFQQLIPMMEDIWRIYQQKRYSFEKEYRRLPKSVFQGDLNPTNICLNDNLEFAGVIDFNTSGTETSLNYIFRECMNFADNEYCLCNKEDNQSLWFYDKKIQDKRDELILNNISVVKRHYNFSEAERMALNTYYNIVVPFWWDTVYALKNTVTENSMEKAEQVLNWIRVQLLRDDIFI